MRELIGTLLDVLGLLLVAAGAGWLAGRLLGWGGLMVCGGVVLAGRWWADRPAPSPAWLGPKWWADRRARWKHGKSA